MSLLQLSTTIISPSLSLSSPSFAQTSSPNPLANRLKGVNHSGFEYGCVQNYSISEGPLDDGAIEDMKTWNINVVRIPLNQDCWLGNHGHNPNYIGENYRKAVEEYVRRLRNHGLVVILDLHYTNGLYNGPGQGDCYDEAALCQKPMPDKRNSPRFWRSVASKFKDDTGIVFDIFNEPFHDQLIKDQDQAWKCVRDGGSACPGFQFEIAGMQDLVDAVRSTRARNLIMSPGIAWTNDLTRWVEFKPKDPANYIAASWHSYNTEYCNNQKCWDSQVAPVAEKYPVIVGEVGEFDCTHTYVDVVIPWLDSKNINYVAFTWNKCSALITDYNGTPTTYGVGVRDHLKRS